MNKPKSGQVYKVKPESASSWRKDTLHIVYVGVDYFTYMEQEDNRSRWCFDLLSDHYTLQGE